MRAQEDKPILLSVGYAACHWCHVMAHESFEDAETAALMNERFVNVKVDREERPDVDAIYMDAVVALTGHGGWPLTVFLTPEGEPFFGGTYFPPEPRHGMPAFSPGARGRSRMPTASAATRSRSVPSVLLEALEQAAAAAPSSEPLTESLLFAATRRLGELPTRSGAASAARRSSRRPRRSSCCCGAARRELAAKTLDGMAAGRHVRPRRRRLPPLLGGRALARAALREDALRQRAARPRLPARLARDRERALPRGGRADARLHGPRAPRSTRAASRPPRTRTPRASRG